MDKTKKFLDRLVWLEIVVSSNAREYAYMTSKEEYETWKKRVNEPEPEEFPPAPCKQKSIFYGDLSSGKLKDYVTNVEISVEEADDLELPFKVEVTHRLDL